MVENVTDRVDLLRGWMRVHDVDVIVVPTMDPHDSEYVADYWKCRQWLTGFTGSAGTAVVTLHEAALWTDSRYWLQAAEQLAATPFQLMREGEDVEISDWLYERQQESQREGGLKVVFPTDMMTPGLYASLFSRVKAKAVTEEPFSILWIDRPPLPYSRAELLPDALAGESAASKMQRLVAWMERERRESMLVNDLSEICWLLNLRGDDVPYNPYLISFLLVHTSGKHTLFVAKEQIPADVSAHLSALGVKVRPYAEGLALHKASIREAVQESPVASWRAIKNATEQAGFREAHVRDGVAMVRFLCWLDKQCAEGFRDGVTEMTVDRVLTAYRAEQRGFRGLSFETIAAYGPHGAIVHYEATPETDVPLEPHGLLLLDSGAHYDCGTTDITRTIALGALTEEERRVYTLVLKGHLQLANLHFPDGTTGLQLDTVARMAMWREGYDFGHGTGHGVGHRLGVHEGPVQIRKNLRQCTVLPFHAGQNITDEPGIYLEGRFGVRIENVLLAQPVKYDADRPCKSHLRFEQLTLCPYDVRPLVVEMLTAEERTWLNDYHERVRTVLSPLLSTAEEREWLATATQRV